MFGGSWGAVGEYVVPYSLFSSSSSPYCSCLWYRSLDCLQRGDEAIYLCWGNRTTNPDPRNWLGTPFIPALVYVAADRQRHLQTAPWAYMTDRPTTYSYPSPPPPVSLSIHRLGNI
jgi:hypothetical protein